MVALDFDGRVVIGGHQRADVAQAFGDHVEDRRRGGQRHVLLETRHAHAGLQPARAGVGRLLAAGDAQQRGLAGAVAADEAHAFAAVDLHRRAVDQGKVSEGDRDAIQRKQWHDRSQRVVGAVARREVGRARRTRMRRTVTRVSSRASRSTRASSANNSRSAPLSDRVLERVPHQQLEGLFGHRLFKGDEHAPVGDGHQLHARQRGEAPRRRHQDHRPAAEGRDVDDRGRGLRFVRERKPDDGPAEIRVDARRAAR